MKGDDRYKNAVQAYKYEIPTTEELAKQIKIEQDNFVDQAVQRLEKMIFESFLKSDNDFVILDLVFFDSACEALPTLDIPRGKREAVFNKLQENLEAKGYFVTYEIPHLTIWSDLDIFVHIDGKDTKLERITYAEAKEIQNKNWKQNSKTYGLSEYGYEKLPEPKFNFLKFMHNTGLSYVFVSILFYFLGIILGGSV